MKGFDRFVRDRLPPLTVAREPEIVDELAQHLGDLYDEARAAGLSHEAALARAASAIPRYPGVLAEEIASATRLRHGPIGALVHAGGSRPDPPPPRSLSMWSDISRDLRYAARLLLHTPGFTAVVVITLALGIGANSAIFSAIDAILLRPAPVADPSRVVSLYTSSSDGRNLYQSSSYPDHLDLRDSGAFAGLAAFASIALAFEDGGVVEQLTGEVVSGDYFDVLGVRIAPGRGFLADEDRPGSPVRVAVASHAFWRRRLGADPAAIGRAITLNGNPYTVVGVTPPGFTAPTLGVAPEIWVPMALQPEVRPPSAGLRRSLGGAGMLDARGVRWMDMVGRLKTGTTVRDAATAVEIVAKRLEASFPNSNRARRFTVVRLGEGPGVRAATRPLLTVLGISVVLVLLIACANIASLLAARAVSRTREVAVRMAVGADRGRLIRQWLTESILLALMGSAGALVVAWGATPLLYRFGVPESVSLGLNTRVFLFTLAAGAGCGVLFGLAPVVQVLRRDTLAALRDEGGTIASGVRAARMRSVFVVVQVALSLMLLVGAGLFLRTLQNAYAVDLGYRLDGTLVANINLDVRGYSQPAGQAVYSQLLERVNALPGVSAAGASRVPVLTGGARTGTLSVDGRPVAPDGSNGLNVRINVVSDRYFETMGIPIVLGRRFSPSDAGTAPRVAVISRQLADRLWPGQDPLGRSLTYAPPALTVIGVVPDTAYSSAVERNPPPVFYVPLAQNYESGVAIYIRTAGDPMSLLPAVRQIVREIDPGLVVVRPRTLVDEFAGSLGNQRLMATLVGLFGGLALLLAAIGLYGVMAHMAAQRTAEIGIRLALGARPSSILTMIVRQGLRLVAIGGAIGLAGAMISVRSVESQLFGVKPTDPTTFVVVAVLLAIVGVLACAVPARRAMKVDPARTLRGA